MKKYFLHTVKYFLCFAILFCFNAQNIFAENAKDIFSKANELYKQQKFEEAAQQYEKIITLGYESAEVHYNLGNCYYKTNQIGFTILNYERAIKLEPDNEDFDFNLRLANLKVNDRIEPIPQMIIAKWLQQFLSIQNADGWSKIALVLIWLSLFLAALFLLANQFKIKRLAFVISFLLLFTSFIFLAIAFKQNDYEQQHRFGIVMVTNTYIKSAPQTNATDLFILREGVKAEITETENDWQKIKLADGKVGWIKANDIEII